MAFSEAEKIKLLREMTGKEPLVRHSNKMTMQDLYGENYKYKCKECKHLIAKVRNKTYYKCALWAVTGGPGTDIRVNSTACKKFEKRL